MKKTYVLAFLFAFILFTFFVLHLQFGADNSKFVANTDKELGYIVDNLEDGDVFSVSDADHAYLFNRLKDRAIGNQKGVMELGLVVYYVRETKNGYVLDNAFEPVNNDYHLALTQKSIQINPAGSFLNIMFIKKVNGPYYNE